MKLRSGLRMGSALGVRVLGAGSNLLLSLACSLMMTPVASGQFFVGLNLVTFLSGPFRFGFDVSSIREVSRVRTLNRADAIPALMHKAVRVTLSRGAVFSLLGVLASSWMATQFYGDAAMTQVLQLAALIIPVHAAIFVLSGVSLGEGYVIGPIASQNIAVPALTSALIYVLSLLKIIQLTPATALAIYLAMGILTAIGALGMVLSRNRKFDSPADDNGQFIANSLHEMTDRAKRAWRYNLVDSGVLWLTPTIAGVLLTKPDIRGLSIALRMSMLLSFFVLSAHASMASTLTRLHTEGKPGELCRVYRTTTMFVMAGALLMSLPLLLLPGWTLSFFGEGMTQYALMLQLLTLGQFFGAFCGPAGQALMMTGHDRELWRTASIAGVIGCIVGVACIFLFGANGAAGGTALAFSIHKGAILARLVSIHSPEIHPFTWLWTRKSRALSSGSP
ncbi:lipopolysaccharide biosynthesis protein [Planctomicrobium piriforme]|uniref:Membrane protein involved in the export of O-antigen and teichoic acid n=1 Tax=Planctomicrobium piriforme TaxID=1576369 RepID=A0A1I3DE97_9PLAN|nr:polysaccharide biosynthesis C-terminal domain-containing protein [Planctomicrobium piriforme]SFH84801.1 Membrane protein involved in the export of O-antigen and teichoic acid [Planctomicrobium piriforme]